MPKLKKSLPLFFTLIALALQACAGGTASTADDGGVAAESGNDGEGVGEAFVPFTDIGSIGLLTTTSGVGAKPLFEWQPVDGAASYSLYVQFADGQPYWAWSGTRTSIYLGGSTEPPAEDTAGPILLEGMSWAVIAYDTDGTIIAASILQAISP